MANGKKRIFAVITGLLSLVTLACSSIAWADCRDTATARLIFGGLNLSEASASRLCGTVRTAQPTSCYALATAPSIIGGLHLSENEAITLCARTTSTLENSPTSCFGWAITSKIIGGLALKNEDAFTLCSGTTSSLVTLSCFQNATRPWWFAGLALSDAQAIERCRRKD